MNDQNEEFDVLIYIDQLLNPDPIEPDRQVEAAITLAKLNDSEYREKIFEALIFSMNSPYALLRSHAAESLGEIGDQRAVPYLINALFDPYKLVRSYSVRALGKLGDEKAKDCLLKTLRDDPFFGARAEAAEALRKIVPKVTIESKKEIMEAIEAHKEAEKKSNDERSKRVLNEMDSALDDLREILYEINRSVKKLKMNKGEYILALTNKGMDIVNETENNADRLGGLISRRT